MSRFKITWAELDENCRITEYHEVTAENHCSAQFAYNTFYHAIDNYGKVQVIDMADGCIVQEFTFAPVQPI